MSASLVMAAAPARGLDGAAGSLRDGFESPRPAWKQEETDVTVNLLAHDRSDLAAREGRLSERFRFLAGPGSALYYSYALPKVPIVDDLEVNLHVRSDHAGIQLLGRVVLPADVDPDTGQPSYVMVPGTIYDSADRWQRLSLADPRAEVERAVRVLRSRTKRSVSVEGAYLEQLVVNLYGGPGETVVYLDDLRIAPVPEAAAAGPEAEAPGPAAAAADEPGGDPPPGGRTADRIRLERNRLSRDGHPWVFTAIRAPGADLDALARYGFDVLAVDLEADTKTAQDAARRGMLLMAGLAGAGAESSDPADLVAKAAAHPARDAVAFWDLGEGLGGRADPEAREDELARHRAINVAFHRAGAAEGLSPLTTGGVVGQFPLYARPPKNLDLIGVHPIGWGSSHDYKDLLRQLARRRELTALSNPEALYWSMIAASAPEEVHQAVWGFDVPPAWGVARVQPEQVRLAAYAALSAGYRGLGFRADADLTRAAGRALLIEMALLNAEIDLFEPILAEGYDPIPVLPAFSPDPQAIIIYTAPGTQGGNNSGGATIRSSKAASKTRPEVKPHPSIGAAAVSSKDNRSKLLLVADLAAGAQWQPPQMAMNDLKIRVPGATVSAQAYEVTLGGVRTLEGRERVPGGVQITLPDFGTSALVLVTSNQALVRWVEDRVNRIRSMAIAMAIEQARLQYQWVAETNGQLAVLGRVLVDDKKKAPTGEEAGLLALAAEFLKQAEEALAREDYPAAWSESRRAGRPLRILMRAHFDQALAELAKAAAPLAERNAPPPPRNTTIAAGKAPPRPKKPNRILTPVSCPPLLAFNTLPQHYRWLDWIRDGRLGDNLLPTGSFVDKAAMKAAGWVDVSVPTEGVVGRIEISDQGPGPGRRGVLKLTVAPPEKGEGIDALPSTLDHPAAALRSPAIKVGAQQLYRISVKVRMPRILPPGGGGLIVGDSLGGEPLQFHSNGPIPDWSEVILYRRSPADGALSVTLGLAGLTVAEFADLKVEAYETRGTGQPPELVQDPPAPRPPAARSPTARAAGRPAR